MIGSVLRVRYEITQLLAESDLVRTYSAVDKVQAREVSVRVIRDPFAQDGELVSLLSEAVSRTSAVRHPNIEELYEIDSDDGAIFIVGQLTKGGSVGERLRKLASFSVPATIELGVACCEGLQALHRAGIAHGDVGSQTVWMQADGETRLQMAGLWQAWYANPEAKEALLVGSAAYTAPEISKGSLPTPASDVYSMGVLLFELVTGRQPYRAENRVGMALLHATEAVPGAKQFNPAVPAALEQIIAKAMFKSTDDRYRDAGELLSDLRMLQDGLRFGKNLSWPFQAPVQEPDTPEPAPKPKKGIPAPLAVPRRAPRPVREPSDADVPAWLRFATIFVSGMIVVVAYFILSSNLKKPQQIQVPDLRHLTVTDAAKKLKQLGLTLGHGRTEPNEQAPADTILSTDPNAGSIVYAGGAVSPVISSGSRFVEVPDLRGVTEDKARAMLTSAGLQLDDNVETVPDRNLAEGLVVSQVPEPRLKYQRQSKVRIKLSAGKSGGSSERDPEANTKYIYSLHIRLVDIDQPVTLKVDMTDSRGTKNVWEKQQQPEDDITIPAEGYGSHVTFRIFYNGELVKQQQVNANDAASDDSGDSTDNKTGDNTDSNSDSKTGGHTDPNSDQGN